MKRNILLFFIITALIAQIFAVTPLYAFTSTNIDPSVFSPDGNGLNDTTVFTVVDTAGQNHYVNIFNQTSGEIVAEDRVMTESPSGTYKYTWNGKDDSNAYVDEETYIIRISTNPSENGDTIGTVEVDLTAPSSPSVSIAGGATYTTTQSVTLTISASEDTSKMQVSNYNNQFSNVSWETFASSKSWTLLANDGTKTVYINFRDTAGTNVSTTDTITLDTSLDTPSLTIDSGASTTSSLSVTLTITAADEVTQMKIDNNTDFTNMTSWITKSSEYDFTLPSGDGNKIVYLRVRDAAGNIKNASDNITLLSAVPTGTLSINDGATYTNSSNVTLTVTATGGPTIMYFSNDGSTWTSYDYEEIHYWNLTENDGAKTVYYKAKNSNGNSSIYSQPITLDTSDPTPVTLLTPADGNTSSTQTPTLTWSNPNSQSSTRSFYVEVFQLGVLVDDSRLNSSTTTYTTDTLSDGATFSWRVTVYDMANNTAITSQRSFSVDVEGLAAPSVSKPASNAYVKDLTPTFEWSAVSGATSYDLYYGDTAEEPLDNTIIDVSSGYSSLPFSDGETVYWAVDAYDGVNHSSPSSTRAFTIDMSAPTGSNISIDSNATYTDSSTVTLTLSATGASMMMISNSASFSGASWETYAASKSWPLSEGEGEKTVYFKVKDAAVNSQGASDPNLADPTNDTIILDGYAPEITDPDPGDGDTTSTTENLAISVTLSDNGSGIDTSTVTFTFNDEVIPNDDANITVSEDSIIYLIETVAEGTYTVNVTVDDYAGHTGYLNWSFTVEEEEGGGTPPPEVTGPSISGVTRSPTIVTSSDTVTISGTVTSTVGLKSVTLSWNDGSSHTKAMTLQSNHLYKAVIGPFTEGITVTYKIIAIDNSSQGTQSSTYNFTVTDTTKPTITIVSPLDESIITNRIPTLEVTYSDSGGINTNSVKLTVDSTDVTNLSTITATKITYTPSEQLSYKTYTATINVSDRAGNKATSTWSFTLIAEEEEMTATIAEILSGETETIDFSAYETALEEIKITAATDLTNVIVNCTVTGAKPEDVTLPPNAVYLYLIIETNVNASDISSATITFKVEQAWLRDNNVNKSAVKLLRYTTNEWQELVPTIIAEDETYIHYDAETTGFSTFAITGAAVQPAGGFPLLFVAIIIIALAIIALIVLLYYRGII